ncbi:MAG TPA: hypothetical protein VFW21_13865 [Mycobacterium sp.]|nr:hypothetical protein [Mycobacterium sp.]
MGRRLDADQFAAYAREQIRDAFAILQRHRPDRYGLCSCGRPQPCTVIDTCQRSIDHYRGKLALIEATQPLPIVAPASPLTAGDYDGRHRQALNPIAGSYR